MKLDNLFETKENSKKPNPVAKAMTQDPQFKSKVVPDKKKQAKAGYQKHKNKLEESMTIDINGPQGNAHYILGVAKKLSDAMGKDWNTIQREMQSGDYRNLLQTFDEYFGDTVELKNAEPYFEGGYEGQSEPTYHIFKGADVNDVKKTIAQKNIPADAEQSDQGVKVHTYDTDRKSVAKELGINEGKPNWGTKDMIRLISVKCTEFEPFTNRNRQPVDCGGCKEKLPDAAGACSSIDHPPDKVCRAPEEPSVTERDVPGDGSLVTVKECQAVLDRIPVQERVVVDWFDHNC